VPAWAEPLDAAQFASLQAALRAALDPIGGQVRGDGTVMIVGRSSTYGLSNLVQQWAQAEAAEQPTLVAEHFERLLASEDAPPLRPGELLDALRPRLWGEADVAQVPFPLITRRMAEELVAVLCVDTPSAVKNLRPEDAAATGWPLDELWQRALAQIDDGLGTDGASLGSGVEATFGDSFFVASRVLDLPRFAGPLPPAGAIVAVPHRHMLLHHPIESIAVLEAVNAIAYAAAGMYRDGPGSIVPHVYWWRHHAPLLHIPTRLDDEGLAVLAPDELTELLESLS
jgi:hypothetical protein